MGNYLYLLIFLACPLMMIFMMRGMRGGRSRDDGSPHHDLLESLSDLRRKRERLDQEIERREAGSETPNPVGRG